MEEIKGYNIISTKKFIAQEYGNEALTKVITALEEDKQKLIDDSALLPNDWFPLEVFLHFVQKASEILANGDEAFITRAQKYNCKYESKLIFSILLKVSTPAFAMKSVPVVFKVYFRNSDAKMEAKVKEIGPKNYEITLSTFSKENRLIEKGILGWWTQMMEMAGARNIAAKIIHSLSKGTGYCTYVITWE